jgi:two-component system, sensor histidine kinase and response regulator
MSARKSIKILIVEDNSDEVLRLTTFIKKIKAMTFKAMVAVNLADALKVLKKETFDAVLLNLSLPDSAGLTTLSKIKKATETGAVIILSASDEEDLALEAARHGAQNYLLKEQLDQNLLLRAIIYAIEHKQIEKGLRQQKAYLEALNETTLGLISRLDIEELLEAILYRAGGLIGAQNGFISLYDPQKGDLVTRVSTGRLKNSIGARIKPGEAITGRVWQSGETMAINDYENWPHRRPHPRTADFRSAVGVPLKLEESVIGVIGLFLPTPFKKHQIEILGQFAELAAIALDNAQLHTRLKTELAERQKTEQALTVSEEKYRTIIDSIQDGYYEVDLKGKYTLVNQALADLRGYTKDDLIKLNYKEYMDEGAVKDVFKTFHKVYKTGKPTKGVWKIAHRDGTVKYGESSVLLIKDAHGAPVGFRGLIRDVTARKAAEEALKASEEKYRTILDSIEDGYFEVDIEGNFTFYNDAAAEMYEYPITEMMGLNYRDYTNNKYAKKLYDAFLEIYRTQKSIRGIQYEVRTKSGKKMHVESSASLIKDRDGNAVGFRGILRDITERKNAERELERAKETAEAATRAKSEFLANMSHEIRTPMNGIIGMYNLLLDTELDEEQGDYVETGKRSADSLLTVINDILDFSKIEAGKLDLEILDFDLRTAMEEVVELPAMHAHEKGLEFAYHVHPDIPSLLQGDPGRLRQVFMNLTGNAIKFTSHGEIVVRAFLEEETKTHIKIRFTVKDSGIGISPADCKRLFSSFNQVDASTTRKYGGTGLGLAISKKLAHLMGGEIGVDSEIGQGSTFWFSAVFNKQLNVVEKKFFLPESIRGKRILIVDDNQTNLEILEGYLKNWGCSCDTAKSGEMALSLLTAVAKVGAPFDLIISDLRMPEMDGAELGRRIKNDPALKDTIMIMLTSQGLRGDATMMKKIGYAAYLTKPIRRSQLFDCLAMTFGTQTNKPKGAQHPIITRHTLTEAQKSKIRILLAEDNLINQKLALRLLEKFGYRAEAVANGREAVKALETTSYDLVLMDVQMPEMDGFEATRTIRNPNSKVRNHEIPIIAMTAHAMKGDRTRCLKEGMDDYVSKPIQPQQFLDTIERYIINPDKKTPLKNL